MPDLGQQRAAHAWKSVQHCTKEYTSLAKSAPALIMSNGLMPTLAFYQAKGREHHKSLLEHLLVWLNIRFPSMQRGDFPSAMTFLHSVESSDYRRATEETLELLRWIRQFAPAVSGDPAAE